MGFARLMPSSKIVSIGSAQPGARLGLVRGSVIGSGRTLGTGDLAGLFRGSGRYFESGIGSGFGSEPSSFCLKARLASGLIAQFGDRLGTPIDFARPRIGTGICSRLDQLETPLGTRLGGWLRLGERLAGPVSLAAMLRWDKVINR